MLNIFLLLITYIFMEFVAWSNHKYVMHGFLWIWHKDHHINDIKKIKEEKSGKFKFEKNDLFFIIYALPAIVLMIIGFGIHNSHLVFIAIGITLYGFTYFVFHDVLYHKRIKFPLLQNSKFSYFQAIVKAHLAHHQPKNNKDFDNYGLLIFRKEYFKD